MDAHTLDNPAPNEPATIEPGSRAKMLKQATHDIHDGLDKDIMSRDPFGSIGNYARFLEVQYRFHTVMDGIYRMPALDPLLPDLDGRRRLHLVAQDLADIGMPLPEFTQDADEAGPGDDMSAAMGWLYVAEGSNLGAAFLLKAAAKLGLSETHGARHLAGHPEGRGLHWRTFTAALDAIPLPPEDEARVIAHAKQAFALVRRYVGEAYA